MFSIAGNVAQREIERDTHAHMASSKYTLSYVNQTGKNLDAVPNSINESV